MALNSEQPGLCWYAIKNLTHPSKVLFCCRHQNPMPVLTLEWVMEEYSREPLFPVPHGYVGCRQMQKTTTRVHYWTPLLACQVTECDCYLLRHNWGYCSKTQESFQILLVQHIDILFQVVTVCVPVCVSTCGLRWRHLNQRYNADISCICTTGFSIQ